MSPAITPPPVASDDAPRKRRIRACWPRLVTAATHRPRTAPTSPPPEVAAMIEVGELLRSANSPRDVFAHLVDIVDRVLPSRAIALASRRTSNEPLVWTNGDTGLEPTHVATRRGGDARLLPQRRGARRARRRAALAASSVGRRCPSPRTTARSSGSSRSRRQRRGRGRGRFRRVGREAPRGPLARAEQLRHVFAAREHARVARAHERPSLRRGAARTRRRRALAALAPYRVRRDSGAAVDVRLSLGAPSRRTHRRRRARERLRHRHRGGVRLRAFRARPVAGRGGRRHRRSSDLVGNVIRYRSAVATARVSPSVPDGDARSRVVAAQARRALGVDWIVSVPISTDGASVLGVLTVFGSEPEHPPLPISAVEELARRAAIAIENGRLYLAAIEASGSASRCCRWSRTTSRTRSA